MKFDRLKIAGLLALTLVMVVTLGACDSAGPGGNGNLTGEYDVTVLVLDEYNDTLQGVDVTLGQMERSTGEDGTAVFENVQADSYDLEVEVAGYAANGEDTGTVTVGQNSTEFTVMMVEDEDSGDDGEGEDDAENGDDDGNEEDDDQEEEDRDDRDDGQDDGEDDRDGDDDNGDDADDDDGDSDNDKDDGDDDNGDDADDDDGDSDNDKDDGDEKDQNNGEYNEFGVLTEFFYNGNDKVVNLGTLEDGDTAIVAISPLNINPNNNNTYDARLNVTFSDGATASQTEVHSLNYNDPEGSESSPQAELDAELRELENEFLTRDLEPVDARGDVTAQGTYQIGDSRSFYNRENDEVKASLETIGDKVLIYLEDGYQLEKETLEEIADAYDNNIYPTVMDYFGFHNESDYDWDGNGRTIILIEDMGGSLQNGMIMGYFHSKDYYNISTSNQADMFYINYQGVREAEDNNNFSLDQVLATVAHEFQHLLFFVNKINAGRSGTDIWINEGFSILAEYLTGYRDYNGDLRISGYYFPAPEQTSVMAWRGKLSDYGASGLIAYYFYEKLGTSIIEDIQTSSNSASDVISRNYRDFSGLFLDWMISNYIDGENLRDYSYSGFNLNTQPALAATIDGSFSTDFSIKSTAVKYFKIEGNGSEVSLEINMNEDTGVIIYNDGEGS